MSALGSERTLRPDCVVHLVQVVLLLINHFMMAWRTGDLVMVRRKEKIVVGGRTGEDPHVTSGGVRCQVT